jgi:hypothetical protein
MDAIGKPKVLYYMDHSICQRRRLDQIVRMRHAPKNCSKGNPPHSIFHLGAVRSYVGVILRHILRYPPILSTDRRKLEHGSCLGRKSYVCEYGDSYRH